MPRGAVSTWQKGHTSVWRRCLLIAMYSSLVIVAEDELHEKGGIATTRFGVVGVLGLVHVQDLPRNGVGELRVSAIKHKHSEASSIETIFGVDWVSP